MRISIKIAVILITFSLLITSFGYIALVQLDKITEPITNDIPASVTKLVEASRLGGQAEILRYYDESLTEAVLNYALSQDKIWEERYRLLEPELDQRMVSIVKESDEKNKEIFSNIQKSSTSIIEMEYKAIDLVNNGKQKEAIDLLESDQYWEQKKIFDRSLREYDAQTGSEYINALSDSAEVLSLAMTNAQKLILDTTQLISLYVLVYLAIAAGLSFFIFRTVTKPVKNLRDAADKITKGDLDVKINPKGHDEINDLAISFKSMVNALKKSKELQAVAEKKYRELYENSPDLYCTHDLYGIITDCNNSYAERLGYPKEEIIGTSIFKYVSDNDVKKIKESFEVWKQTGYYQSSEIRFKAKHETTFPVLISGNNTYDENANLIASTIIIKDISEIYDAREKMEQQRMMELQLAELKKLDKLKNEFASMITHELKTPLAPIIGYCDMLKEPGLLGNLNSKQLDSLDRITKSAYRLKKLIGDVLEAQKLEMGSIKFEKEKFEVTEFMNEVHKDYCQILNEKQIKILNFTEDNLTLTSDKNRIRQVIDNLVLNSADFVPEKGGEIQIGAINQDKKIIFHVKDNGVGIPQSELDRIFVKFYQIDTSPTRKHPGTGLGLAVCKGIVEGLGGKIWVESQPLKGSSFYFSIPKE